jgi:anti-sigma B factor antagonist
MHESNNTTAATDDPQGRESEALTPPGQDGAELTPQGRGGTPMMVVVRDEPKITIVAVAGEIDLLTAPRLAAALDPILAADTARIAVDLTDVTFIDSAGIHVLVNASNRASCHVAVICGPGTVRRTLELLGLIDPLSVVSTLDDYKLHRVGP